MDKPELIHYGTKRHSGRYPYGSGDRPYQHGGGSGSSSKKKKGASAIANILDDVGQILSPDFFLNPTNFTLVPRRIAEVSFRKKAAERKKEAVKLAEHRRKQTEQLVDQARERRLKEIELEMAELNLQRLKAEIGDTPLPTKSDLSMIRTGAPQLRKEPLTFTKTKEFGPSRSVAEIQADRQKIREKREYGRVLTVEEHQKKALEANRARDVLPHASQLSNEDLQKAVQRVKLQKQLKELAADEAGPVEKAFRKVGRKILDDTADSVTRDLTTALLSDLRQGNPIRKVTVTASASPKRPIAPEAFKNSKSKKKKKK